MRVRVVAMSILSLLVFFPGLAMAYDYKEALIWTELANGNAKAAKYQLALGYYKQVLALGKQKAFAGYAHLQIGKIYLKKGQILKATKNFQTALQIAQDPKVPKKYHHRAQAKQQLKKLKKSKPAKPPKKKQIGYGECLQKVEDARDEVREEMSDAVGNAFRELRASTRENVRLKKIINGIKKLVQ